MKIARFFRHIFSPPWRVRLVFPEHSLNTIEKAIAASEYSHLGELRFVVEHALGISALWRGVTPRERALEVFSQYRVWDTRHNSGVLIYLLLADRDVEIVADRGIYARVDNEVWTAVCTGMESWFRRGEFERGVIEGIETITDLLQEHFPARNADNPNEIADAPIVL